MVALKRLASATNATPSNRFNLGKVRISIADQDHGGDVEFDVGEIADASLFQLPGQYSHPTQGIISLAMDSGNFIRSMWGTVLSPALDRYVAVSGKNFHELPPNGVDDKHGWIEAFKSASAREHYQATGSMHLELCSLLWIS